MGGWVLAELVVENGYFLFKGLEQLVIPFTAGFLGSGGGPFFRKRTTCWVSWRRRWEKSATMLSMSVLGPVSLASKSWSWSWKWDSWRRVLSRSCASGDQSNRSRGDGEEWGCCVWYGVWWRLSSVTSIEWRIGLNCVARFGSFVLGG